MSREIGDNTRVKTAPAPTQAKSALLEQVEAAQVGAHLGTELTQDGDATIALHTFACESPAYPGWYWEVCEVLFADSSTISEINLLPGEQALVPPAWQPWASRIEPGDLTPGDLLPTDPQDERLTAGFTQVDDETAELFPQVWELGLGREQILSDFGRARAISRWMAGENGPRSQMARQAPSSCQSCGYLVTIGGSLGQAFGVCGNEFGASDGQLVAMTFGCGAHSSVREQQRPPVPVVGLVIDDVADANTDASEVAQYVAAPEEVDSVSEPVIEDDEPQPVLELEDTERMFADVEALVDLEGADYVVEDEDQ
jgi:hypothetical protein